MRTIIIDCSDVNSEASFWSLYLSVVQPDGPNYFGRNLSALRDAILGGGPGYPGECKLRLLNSAHLEPINRGELLQGLRSISLESTSIPVFLE